MDLRQLEMFKNVAEMGGFTRASEKLHVSHSAISRQVKLLEEELGRLLFTRENKRVALTQEGKVLLPHVDSIFAQLAQAVQAVTQTGRGQHLRIGTGTTMLSLFLPPILQQFRARHPDVNVQITTGHTRTILDQIRAKELDLGIVSLPAEVCGLSVTPLYREEIVIAVRTRHPLSVRKTVRPEELASLPLIAFSKGSSTRAVLDQFFHEIGVTPSIELEVENDEAAERASAAGLGFCFLPRARAARDGIHYLRIEGHPIHREVALVCSPPLNGLTPEFLVICRAHVQRLRQPSFGDVIRPRR
jgi:DNA-binding transcriptional LysR family regulator